METSRSISHNNLITKCGKYFVWFLRSFLPVSLLPYWEPLQSNLASLTRQMAAPLGWSVGNLKVEMNEAMTNGRVMVGYVLMGVGALSYEAHLLFIHPEIYSPFAFINDPEVPKGVFYYKRWFYWFFTNREEFLFIFASAGMFLRLPSKWGFRYLAVPVIAWLVCEVLYQTFFISHYTHFYTSFFTRERGWELFVILVAVVFGLFKALHYSAYRKYHLKDGNAARIMGVFMLDIPWDQKKEHFETLKEEMENYNSRV